MRIIFLSVLACLAFLTVGRSQSLKQVLEAGDESFRNRDYYNAYRCYEAILKYAADGAYKEDTLRVKFSYARSAQRLNYFSKANDLYGQLMQDAKDADKDIYARSVFNRAKMLQNLAQDNIRYYDEALDTYHLFVSESLFRNIEGESKIQARFRQEAESGIQSCDSLRNLRVARTDSLYRLTEAVNSGYSELAPVLMGNTLYFSSVRFLPKNAKNPRQPLYFAKQMKAEFRKMDDPAAGLEVTDTTLALLPELETFNADNIHTLHTAFTRDTALMFFTQCIQENEDIFCSLYLRRRLDDGSWGKPEKLPANAEGKEFTTTQPSTSFDCASGKEWLYFSSDRPGTLGGLDIWRAEIAEGGSLGDPENLSAINTAWNEATPFYHSQSGRLYFSSDAPPSYGEYDIFYSEFQDGSWSVPKNMGIPYNSGYNDKYFFLSQNGKEEYFISDRPRSFRFVEELEFCCTDIYTMGNKVDRVIEVSVEDCDAYSTSEKTVEVYELSCGQRTLVGTPQIVKGNGTATFAVQLYHKYEIVARSEALGLSREKQYDLSESQYVDSGDKISWIPELFYPTWQDLKVVAYDKASGASLHIDSISVTAIETGARAPDKGGNVFRIGPNVNYSVKVVASPVRGDEGESRNTSSLPPATAARPVSSNYLSADTTYSFDLSDPEMMKRLCGNKELRIPMSPETPPLDLPIVLYFDHDMPLRYNDRADQTRQSFEDAISRYLEQRENYLKNNDNPQEQRRVNPFFDREVSGGLSTLENLAKSLLGYVDYMGEDDQLVIEIQGYCSPRGKDSYNRLLSKRRIQCVRSYLESYTQNGRGLRDYIGTRIIIKELPLGESKASSAYPDKDPNSIWGIAPALDRRVEIQNLTTGESITTLSGQRGVQEPEQP